MRVHIVGHCWCEQVELRTSHRWQVPVEKRELRLEQIQRARLDDFAVTVEAHAVGTWFLAESDEDARSRTFCEFRSAIVVEDVGAAEQRTKA
jgi:hypothetical protein